MGYKSFIFVMFLDSLNEQLINYNCSKEFIGQQSKRYFDMISKGAYNLVLFMFLYKRRQFYSPALVDHGTKIALELLEMIQ